MQLLTLLSTQERRTAAASHKHSISPQDGNCSKKSRLFISVTRIDIPNQQISIFVDIGLDDSYTPQKISIRAGTYLGDLQEVYGAYS